MKFMFKYFVPKMYQKNSQNYVGIRSPSGDCGNGIFEMQIFLDFVSDLRGRRGRHRQKRSFWRNFAQFVQQVVVGAEVVSPLADAVRLVDGETRNSVGSDDFGQFVGSVGHHFRRDVQNADLPLQNSLFQLRSVRFCHNRSYQGIFVVKIFFRRFLHNSATF